MKIAILAQRILPAIWLGAVCAIAVEAQLKFKAPGITRELGLGIGKLVFTALNRAEIGIAIVLGFALIFFSAGRLSRIFFGFLAIILGTQTFWLMPALIGRIDAIISGNPPPESSLHIAYVVLEIVKILLLLMLSISVNWPAKMHHERY
jgi:hypothetical protein